MKEGIDIVKNIITENRGDPDRLITLMFEISDASVVALFSLLGITREVQPADVQRLRERLIQLIDQEYESTILRIL